MSETDRENIKRIYKSALRIEAGARAGFLDKACDGDPETREAVENLISLDQSETEDRKQPSRSEPAVSDQDELSSDTPTKIFKGIGIATEIEHYRLISRIGKGGMGDVYLAEDNNLGRKVAIKFLSRKLTKDTDWLPRFIHEAKSVSSLNHPNIITIHEIRKHEDTHLIVSEFIDGVTLGEMIGEGKIAIPEAVDTVIQIASALAAAHEAGIIHRDIKPDNIMRRVDGLVKVLDFGVAKVVTSGLKKPIDSEADTKEKVITRSDMILGTPQYMSPEQARGKSVDGRSDIFSLGIVFYEMITGHSPYPGEDSIDIIGSILKDEPPPLKMYLDEPPENLEAIIRKSLEKEPSSRYDTIDDFLTDLRGFRDELTFRTALSSDTGRVRAVTTGKHKRFFYFNKGFLFVQVLLLVSVSALIAFALFRIFNGGVPTETAQREYNSVEIANWSSAQGELFGSAAFSSDGKFVAFDSSKSGTMSIWAKQTGTGEAFEVTKNEEFTRYPVWSANGEYLAYYSHRGGIHGIWRIPFTGGSPESVATVKEPEPRLKLWASSGKIYFHGSYNLFAVDVKTGATSQVTGFRREGVPVKIIEISRDEKNIAYADRLENKWIISVFPVGSTQATEVVTTEKEIADVVWHPDGRHLFYSAYINGFYQVFEVDSVQKDVRQITFGEKDSHVLDAASDGNALLIGSATEESDIWRVNVEDPEETVVAADIASELWPDVAPDNDKLVFQFAKNLTQANRLFDSSIVTISIKGEGSPVVIAENGYLPQWSSNGKELAFLRIAGDDIEIWKAGASGGGLKQLAKGGISNIGYTVSPYLMIETSHFKWSPVEAVLAYTATRDGLSNLRLVSSDGSGDKKLTSNTDPELKYYSPVWSADGKRIAFVSKKRPKDKPGSAEYRIGMFDLEKQAETGVFESPVHVRLLGWSVNGDELIFAVPFPHQSVYLVQDEVQIRGVNLVSHKDRLIATLKSVYLYNIHLSPDSRSIAYTSRTGNNDEVWIIPANAGQTRRITKNSDPRLYFSSLSWSPDSKSIVFGKQSRFSLLSMIVNLEKTEDQDEK